MFADLVAHVLVFIPGSKVVTIFNPRPNCILDKTVNSILCSECRPTDDIFYLFSCLCFVVCVFVSFIVYFVCFSPESRD